MMCSSRWSESGNKAVASLGREVFLRWLLGLVLIGARSISRAPVRADVWSTGYYPGYEQSSMPASVVDFTALTHVIHFSVSPKADGTLNTTVNGITASRSNDLVSRGHTAGK